MGFFYAVIFVIAWYCMGVYYRNLKQIYKLNISPSKPLKYQMYTNIPHR